MWLRCVVLQLSSHQGHHHPCVSTKKKPTLCLGEKAMTDNTCITISWSTRNRWPSNRSWHRKVSRRCEFVGQSGTLYCYEIWYRVLCFNECWQPLAGLHIYIYELHNNCESVPVGVHVGSVQWSFHDNSLLHAVALISIRIWWANSWDKKTEIRYHNCQRNRHLYYRCGLTVKNVTISPTKLCSFVLQTYLEFILAIG
jgi:hypothetical protein